MVKPRMKRGGRGAIINNGFFYSSGDEHRCSALARGRRNAGNSTFNRLNEDDYASKCPWFKRFFCLLSTFLTV